MRRTSVWMPGQRDRDRRVGVGRQRLLGAAALVAQPGLTDADLRVGRVGGRHEPAERRVDVGEHGLVDVDAAEALHALGRAEQLEAGLGLADDRGVERAAAEVVHGDDLAGFDPLLAGVGDGGRLGLGDEHDPLEVEAGEPGGLPEQALLVLAVVGRVGEDDDVGRRALALASPARRSSAAGGP